MTFPKNVKCNLVAVGIIIGEISITVALTMWVINNYDTSYQVNVSQPNHSYYNTMDNFTETYCNKDNIIMVYHGLNNSFWVDENETVHNEYYKLENKSCTSFYFKVIREDNNLTAGQTWYRATSKIY